MKTLKMAAIASIFAASSLCAVSASAQLGTEIAQTVKMILLETGQLDEEPRGQRILALARNSGYGSAEVCGHLASLASGLFEPGVDPRIGMILRRAAISALGDIRCTSSVPMLKELQESGNPLIVPGAIMSLVRIGGDHVVGVTATILGDLDQYSAGDRSCLLDELLIYTRSGQAKADGVDLDGLQGLVGQHVAREPDKSLTKTLESIKIALAEEINKE